MKVTKVFRRNWLSTKKIVINRGGTRSGKTYSICQQLATWLMTGQYRKGQFLMVGTAAVVRKYKATLKATVIRDFEEILFSEGAYRSINHNKTDRTYSFDGRVVEFIGADDQQKLRGFKCDFLYCNEGNELTYKKEFFQLLIRTRLMVIIDFNPSDPYIWINEEIEQLRSNARGDVDVLVSTYSDNPFLESQQVEEIEYLEQTDKELWQVYGLGQYGKVTGLIFPEVTIIQDLPEQMLNFGYGQDFGFTNDVSATPRCGVKGKNLYLDECLYETGMTNDDLSDFYQSIGIRRKLDKIWADAAEPKSIEEIKRKGWRIKGARKGKDSVKFGIDTLKRYHIHITARSVNFQKEQKKYKYKQLPNGDYSNKPIDLYNHLWDATRYWAIEEIGSHSSLPTFRN